ncbi:MAG: hypothetical protein AAFR52_19235, partial [Pseudomonadota bacterium]
MSETMTRPFRTHSSGRALGVMAPALALALAGCATAVPSGSLPVTKEFSRGGGLFSTGTTVDFAVASREIDGRLGICGAWRPANITAQARSYLDDAVQSGQVQVDRRTVLRRIDRFNRLPEGAPLEGARAQCLVTDIPWEPGFAEAETEVRFARLQFDLEAGVPGSASTGISFR